MVMHREGSRVDRRDLSDKRRLSRSLESGYIPRYLRARATSGACPDRTFPGLVWCREIHAAGKNLRALPHNGANQTLR